MRRVLVLVALAGCGGKALSSGAELGASPGPGNLGWADPDASGGTTAPPGPPPSPTVHDEDGDGVADAFDNCPNVPNPDQAGPPGPSGVGDACRVVQHGTRAWAANARRVTFDPFTSLGSWAPLPNTTSAMVLGADRDSLHGEGPKDPMATQWLATLDVGLPAASDDALVLTAVIRWSPNNTTLTMIGIVANVVSASMTPLQLRCSMLSFDGKTFGVDVECPTTAHSDKTPGLSSMPQRLGVRAIVSQHAPNGIECQLYDPARPATLTDPNFVAWAEPLGDLSQVQWPAANGRVGIFARGAAVDVESIDVLRLSN